MRTRRPSRFHRHAQSRAAASPAASPSASTITSRTSFGQIESAQPGSRKRSPCGRPVACMAARQVRSLPDHQHSPGSASARRRPAWAEHHLLPARSAPSPAVAREECAVDRQRRSVRAVCHQRHHRRPDAARGMLQAGMEAKRVGWRQVDAARGEIGLDQRSLCRLGGLPDGNRDLAAPGVVLIWLALDRRTAWRTQRRARTNLGRQPEQAGDMVLAGPPVVASEAMDDRLVGPVEGDRERAVAASVARAGAQNSVGAAHRAAQ